MVCHIELLFAAFLVLTNTLPLPFLFFTRYFFHNMLLHNLLLIEFEAMLNPIFIFYLIFLFTKGFQLAPKTFFIGQRQNDHNFSYVVIVVFSNMKAHENRNNI